MSIEKLQRLRFTWYHYFCHVCHLNSLTINLWLTSFLWCYYYLRNQIKKNFIVNNNWELISKRLIIQSIKKTSYRIIYYMWHLNVSMKIALSKKYFCIWSLTGQDFYLNYIVIIILTAISAQTYLKKFGIRMRQSL